MSTELPERECFLGTTLRLLGLSILLSLSGISFLKLLKALRDG